MHFKAFTCLFAFLFFSSCTKDKVPSLEVSPHHPFVCDSTVTYSAYIAPIMTTYCTISGCHAGSYPAAGVQLSDYMDCKLHVINSNLLGTVKHAFGSPPMPYPIGSPPLSDSVINIIQCWSDKGFLN